MTRGNAKATRWAIVINAPKESQTRETLKEYLIKIFNHYQGFLASIIHDKDIEDGKQKAIHCHLFLTTSNIAKSDLLIDLVELLKIDKNQISIEATNSDILQVQYLIHKNDISKYQYESEAILTNDKDELLRRLNETYKSPEEKEQDLINDLANMDLSELVKKYGLEIGRRYLSLRKELKDETMRKEAHARLIADFSHLERRFNQLYDLAHKLILDAGKCLNDTAKGLIGYRAKLEAIENLYLTDEIDADLTEDSD